MNLGDNPAHMKRPRSPESVEAIAERLISLRIALGYESNQAAFANLVEISPQAWNNYERARRRIGLDEALKLRRKTGAPLDWIYCEDMGDMPVGLAQRLQGQPPRRRA